MAAPCSPPCSLSAQDLEDFSRRGFVRVRGAFSAQTAARGRAEVWRLLGSRGVTTDPASWAHVKVGLDRIFSKQDGEPWASVFTPALQAALDGVLGQDRYEKETFGCGWWMVTFPPVPSPVLSSADTLPNSPAHCGGGSGEKEQEWGADGRWHIDGWHHHYLFSKEIGVVVNMFFSDVFSSEGGTALAVGSHRIAAQILAEAGLKGLSSGALSEAVAEQAIARGRCEVVEALGGAGDVLLMHPLLLHARSKNLGKRGLDSVRIMCHPCIPLKDHMQLLDQGKGQGRSVLEESIYRAVVGYSSSSDDIAADGVEREESVKRMESSQASLGESLLYRITPQACAEFSEEQRLRLIAKRKHDAIGDDCDSDIDDDSGGSEDDRWDEMHAVMGFASFGSSRNEPFYR